MDTKPPKHECFDYAMKFLYDFLVANGEIGGYGCSERKLRAVRENLKKANAARAAAAEARRRQKRYAFHPSAPEPPYPAK
jgi:hypothetical protein